MKTLFLNLMLRFALIISILIMLIAFVVVYCFYSSILTNIDISITWIFTFAGLTAGLLAQVYIKLQSSKSLTNVTVSELNRITDIINTRSKPILNLILFNILMAIISTLCLQIIPTNFIKSLSLALAPLWITHILFVYLNLEDIENFLSNIKKRKLESDKRDIALKSLTTK